MANKRKSFLSNDMKRIIMLVLGLACSTLVLTFSVLTLIAVQKETYEAAPKYLVWVFVFMGLTRLVTFIQDRSKYNLIRCLVLLAFDISLGIIVVFANNNPYLFSISAGLYCLTVIISRVFKTIQRHTVRDIVFNAIIVVFAILLACGLFIPVDLNNVSNIILIECIFIAVTSLIEVASVTLAQLKFKILFKIVLRTYTLEILFGLSALMVAFSLVFMAIEPAMPTFGDALWYSFAVVTTIGFGDMVATTIIGRVLTAILGMYGIVAVAVITSIIVNFYNETSNAKEDKKQIKDVRKEEDDN